MGFQSLWLRWKGRILGGHRGISDASRRRIVCILQTSSISRNAAIDHGLRTAIESLSFEFRHEFLRGRLALAIKSVGTYDIKFGLLIRNPLMSLENACRYTEFIAALSNRYLQGKEGFMHLKK